MKKLTVAVLSGGRSSEREVSLKSGDQVFEALDKQRYRVLRYDPSTDLNRLVADAGQIDAALIILHGIHGEDGTVQGLLDLLDIPYQGSGVIGSAIGMNKLASKHLYDQMGLPTPPYIVIHRKDRPDTGSIGSRLGFPVVVKPANGGSSIGMSIVKSEADLPEALETAWRHDDVVLIESFIKGIELTGGILGNDELRALPIVEILPGEGYEFFDFQAKYTPGATREICPARIDDALTEKAQTYAKMAHQALFCRGYSRTDMILCDRDIYVLETNTIPGMTPTSLFPLAAGVAGISFSELLDTLIDLSIQAHKDR
jgi:D-alanine-D-alanine ligase